MADEATIQSSLLIRAGNISYQSQPVSFRATVTGRKGPVPGCIRVPITGVSVNFTELVLPSLCRIQNLDVTNFVTVGIWDPNSATFYPVLDLLAGESYVMRLSRFMQSDLGTGSGTDGGSGNRLRLRADTAACNVVIEAFEF